MEPALAEEHLAQVSVAAHSAQDSLENDRETSDKYHEISLGIYVQLGLIVVNYTLG